MPAKNHRMLGGENDKIISFGSTRSIISIQNFGAHTST